MTTPDDDPTHALDDFVRRMRTAGGGATAAPDLSDLSTKLHPARSVTPPRARGGVLRSGQRWNAGDVEDVPIIEVPRQPPPRADLPELTLPEVDTAPPPDAASLDDATRQASERIASLWQAEAQAAGKPVWQPDPQALQLRPVRDPRLLSRWQPGAWTGAVREVFDGATEFVKTAGGPAVQTYPAHRLLALWPPQTPAAPLPARWPQQVQLSAVEARDAPAALLALVPDGAPLWLHGDAQAVDWTLAAEIVLHHDPALRPFQADGLRDFIAAEREASFARLNADYQQATAGGPVLRR